MAGSTKVMTMKKISREFTLFSLLEPLGDGFGSFPAAADTQGPRDRTIVPARRAAGLTQVKPADSWC